MDINNSISEFISLSFFRRGAVTGAWERPCPHRAKTTATPALPHMDRGGDKGIVTERSEPNAPTDRSSGRRCCRCRRSCRRSTRTTRGWYRCTKPTSSRRRNRQCRPKSRAGSPRQAGTRLRAVPRTPTGKR